MIAGLDRSLTTEPEDGFSDFCEKIGEAVTPEFWAWMEDEMDKTESLLMQWVIHFFEAVCQPKYAGQMLMAAMDLSHQKKLLKTQPESWAYEALGMIRHAALQNRNPNAGTEMRFKFLVLQMRFLDELDYTPPLSYYKPGYYVTVGGSRGRVKSVGVRTLQIVTFCDGNWDDFKDYAGAEYTCDQVTPDWNK